MGFETQQNHLVNYPIGLGCCLSVYAENHFRYEGVTFIERFIHFIHLPHVLGTHSLNQASSHG